MHIALVAHDRMKDRMKDRMVMLATEFSALLQQHTLMATGTTGGRLQAEVGLSVERLLSGPLGGDLQIGARLSVGQVDAVVFLRDPMTAHPRARHQRAGACLRRTQRTLCHQRGHRPHAAG